ncbi:MAG: type I polyketide synthase, partial [Chloroflexi bacterium]|nr:type I polyketide synthase [Chloroflexota bacterium]
GVFVGIGESDYALVAGLHDLASLEPHQATGVGHSIAAGRLAYTLGVQGPTLAVDTACSSALVAIHLACQSLRSGECDLALAGAVSLLLAPTAYVALSQMQALSPDGRCKTFDAAADGYGRGEGGAMVLLKRLADAEADGDTVLALIRGSAVNHDGPSSGLTVPNRRAQEKLLAAALAHAQIQPNEVSYIEAHGTGTPLGDPIELRAIDAVFGRSRPYPLYVGSVKTHIGHLEAAAGIAGFVKTVLALQHGQIPPHLHFTTPTPHVDWEQMAVRVPTALQMWPSERWVAGVSAFGLSGTNAHLILEAAPPQTAAQTAAQTASGRTYRLLPLSLRETAALPDLAARYLEVLETAPDLDALCYTAAVGRNHFAKRVALVASDQNILGDQLAALAHGKVADGIVQGKAGQYAPRMALLFSGQGAQYVGMGLELYRSEPFFQQTLERCAALLEGQLDRPLLEILADPTAIHQTACTQPALFALEYSLAMLWLSWGIQPELLLGHSVGELAAACVAGVFSLEDGLRLVAARGRLMGSLPQEGEMVALPVSEVRAREAIAAVYVVGQSQIPLVNGEAARAEVAIAAVNGPQSVVIAGRRAAVQKVVQRLAAEGVKGK